MDGCEDSGREMGRFWEAFLLGRGMSSSSSKRRKSSSASTGTDTTQCYFRPSRWLSFRRVGFPPPFVNASFPCRRTICQSVPTSNLCSHSASSLLASAASCSTPHCDRTILLVIAPPLDATHFVLLDFTKIILAVIKILIVAGASLCYTINTLCPIPYSRSQRIGPVSGDL